MKKPLGLYIHIPFCKTLCYYCDFCKFINQTNERITNYIDHLIKEIEQYKDYFNDITSIYIGGGTPNSIPLNELKRLFKTIEEINPIEYSIETNIEYITQEFIDLLKTTKVNRISIGIQTFNNRLIKEINRFHTQEMALEKIELLRKNNYNNINIDMMYAMESQSINDLEEDLKLLKKIDVEHVSYYSLILEENSVFGKKNKEKESLVDNDLEAKMNELVLKKLKEFGYNHYEISNFSKQNKESYHNKLYWNREEYIGCGASSSSYFNNINRSNSGNFHEYLNGVFEENESSIIDKKQEFFWLGLRLIQGVSINKFKEKFNENPFEIFPINKLIDMDLLQINNDNLRLTDKGILLGNIVFMHFID